MQTTNSQDQVFSVRCGVCVDGQVFPSLTIPLAAASLSLPRTVATLTPMGVFSKMLTDVSDVMSNSGLLSFSSRMVIDT